MGELSGRRVVVTRATEQAGSLVAMLAEAGAEVVEFPTIKTVPPASYAELDAAIVGMDGFDYVVFTSANALTRFMARMVELGRGAEKLSGIGIIAVGPKTAALLGRYGLKADLVPKVYKAEGVLEALSGVEVAGRRFLFPRAEAARDELPEGLRARGAEVVLATAYRTVAPEVDPGYVRGLFEGGGVSAVAFTSSSTVRNFVEMVGEKAREYLSGVCVACIGTVTAATCEEMGIRPTLVPDEFTVEALVGALKRHFGRRSQG